MAPLLRRRRATARAARARGFTLLEILVVLVIVAVMATIAVLAVGTLGQDREIEGEIDRYTDVAAAALEQAQLEGRDFGIWVGPASYEVLVYEPVKQAWESLADDRLLGAHELPAGLAFTLEIEGKALQLGVEKPDAPRVPQVLLYASGDASPYRLAMARDTSPPTRIDGAADGTLQITKPESAP